MGQAVMGMLGGMSWESTALYYQLVNEGVHARRGGHHNACSLVYSLDFDDLLTLADADDWAGIDATIVDGARILESAGASFVIITSVTGNASADAVGAAIDVPLLHIADPVAAAITARGMTRVGLLATRFTIERGFLQARLRSLHGIETLAPNDSDRDEVHRIIIERLTLGRIEAADRDTVLAVSRRLIEERAEAIVVACTELPLLLRDDEYPAPAFDATRLHAEAAVDLLLSTPSASRGTAGS